MKQSMHLLLWLPGITTGQQQHGFQLRQQQLPVAGGAFKYIQDVLEEPPGPADLAAAVQAAVLASLPALAELGSVETARLVLQHFPQEHGQVVQALEPTPQLQFHYLQAASQVTIHHANLLFGSRLLTLCVFP